MVPLIKAARPHQWVKNLLLFVPIIMAHHAGDVGYLWPAFLGFVAFCLCASAVYLINDILDIGSDRAHPKKKNRPIAAGTLTVKSAIIAALVLLVSAFVVGTALPDIFQEMLLLYFALTTLYSHFLKREVIADILLLSGLYTIRIMSGGYAASVPVSKWLLVFSMFIFLSLACIKRYSELLTLKAVKGEAIKGRGYLLTDLPLVAAFGIASGYISTLVLALYINSQEVTQLYSRPQIIWLVCPLLLYWISRIWFLANRGEVHEDPILFALEDRISFLVGALCAVLVYLAI